MNHRSGHWERLEEDYALLARFGIRTIRESVGWRACAMAEPGAGMARVARTAALARKFGLQVIWTLHHYGVPDGVDMFSRDFPAQLAEFCDEAARTLKDSSDGPLFFQPVN